MSVTLSSDLIMDVMRSADPNRREVAVAKLRTVGRSAEHDVASADFADTLNPLTQLTDGSTRPAGITGEGTTGRMATSPYREFERMVLRNLFETLLPVSDSGVFGSGPGAAIWRSMAADQMAGIYADDGGVGIADMLQKVDGKNPSRQTQWPYFSVSQINGFTG